MTYRLKTLVSFITLLSLALLMGCNGSSEQQTSASDLDPDTAVSLELQILDENCQAINSVSFTAGDRLCIQASAEQNNQPISSLPIEFSASIGALSQSSKLTNAEGKAQITMTSEEADIGAAELIASYQDTSVSLNYEFLAGTITPQLPQITLTMFRGSELLNRFKQGEEVQLIAALTDSDGSAMENQIIRFSAELGTLSANSALTDQSGKTTINLQASSSETLGAAVLSAEYDLSGQVISQSFNYEVLQAQVIDDQQVKAGYFDENNQFINNQLGLTLPVNNGAVQLSAGGTLGLKLVLVDENDQRLLTPTQVTFTSSCVESEQAQIDTTVLTVNGEASATYEDLSCAGALGNQDQISARVSINGEDLILSQVVQLSAEKLGALEFVSAQPDDLVLKGTGGQNKQEVSTLTFLVKGELGNPLAQQQVDFELDTTVGGLEISPVTSFTNSQGQVSTKVTSGTVPTVVRVTAKSTPNEGETITTQSDLLSVNTGLADQNSFTLNAEVSNVEGHNVSGNTIQVTARLADSFNNPVPDGTTVNFTTEGGQIESSCQTNGGACSVTWTSAEPRLFNHRATVLATAIGHETFFDGNGNNQFDDDDGSAIAEASHQVSSGINRTQYQASGFIDMYEAWRDDNENFQYDQGEIFIDFNNNQSFDSEDGLFNGPQCTATTLCAAEGGRSLNVRKSIRLIMSSSFALYSLRDTTADTLLATNYSAGEGGTSTPLSISRGNSRNYQLRIADTALQTMAQGTQISITASAGNYGGPALLTLASSIGTSLPISQADLDSNISFSQAISKGVFGGLTLTFSLSNTLTVDDPAVTSAINVTITSPSGSQTNFTVLVPLL